MSKLTKKLLDFLFVIVVNTIILYAIYRTLST
jgi:hypothetical protein